MRKWQTWQTPSDWRALTRATLAPGLAWQRVMMQTYLSLMVPVVASARPPVRPGMGIRIVPVPTPAPAATADQQELAAGPGRGSQPSTGMYAAMDDEELAEAMAFHETQTAYHTAWQSMQTADHAPRSSARPIPAIATQATAQVVWVEDLPPVGHSAMTTRTFHAEDVIQFAHLSGDKNPLHLDPEAWVGTPFTGNLVHGVLTASLFSQLLGMELPGPGTIYLGQVLKFQAPVYIGESVSARVTVTQVREDKRIITLQTHAWVTRAGELVTVLDGEAIVKVMTRPALGEPSA